MEIRPATTKDPERLIDLDGTIESGEYLHVDRSGEGLAVSWKIEPRPSRAKFADRNNLDDESAFMLRQVTAGHEDGLAMVAEHDGVIVASLLAHVRPEEGVLHLVDLRVDYDERRQGLGAALLFSAIQDARRRELRAVTARTLSNNVPAANLLLKCGFDLAGLDTHRLSNHDLVKEQVTLLWYHALD
jgi:ribosomal protein S18 acetylase RimI-like enzyme